MPRCICGRRSSARSRLAQTPWLNHSWHVVLYVSARGLTTSAIPYGDRSFQLDFDFLDHVLRASASDGGQEEIGLYPRSVAAEKDRLDVRLWHLVGDAPLTLTNVWLLFRGRTNMTRA